MHEVTLRLSSPTSRRQRGGGEGWYSLLILDVTAWTARGWRIDRETHDVARGCAYLQVCSRTIFMAQVTRECQGFSDAHSIIAHRLALSGEQIVEKPPPCGRNATVPVCVCVCIVRRSADSSRFSLCSRKNIFREYVLLYSARLNFICLRQV